MVDVCRGPFESNILHDAQGNPIGSDVTPGARLLVDAAVVLPPLSSVAINDAGAGVTEASVKIRGAAFTDGSLAAGGTDPLGDQYPLPLSALGAAVLVSSAPIALTPSAPTPFTVVGGVSVPLGVVPVGCQMIVINVHSTAGDIFLSFLGPATIGFGQQLISGSTLTFDQSSGLFPAGTTISAISAAVAHVTVSFY
jgi:hypothetical protein